MSKEQETWAEFAETWRKAGCILGAAVGPVMAPTREHLLCEDFVRRHPDSALFLLERLRDPDPYLAGYAFKCLIRVRELERDDVPQDVLGRSERVAVLQTGCVVSQQTLGEFFNAYWPEEDLKETEPAELQT